MKQRTIIATIATAIVAGISHAEWSAPLVRVANVRNGTGLSMDEITNVVASAAVTNQGAVAQASVNAVHYTADTGKSAAEKAQARANIGAVSSNDAVLKVTDVSGNKTAVTIGIRKAGSVGVRSFSNGNNVLASHLDSHAEGVSTVASNYYAHAEGNTTTASGFASHAEGQDTVATNYNAHAEGYKTYAYGQASHSEGYGTYAIGNYSHAEGYNSKSFGKNSHAEGHSCVASNENAHAEGYSTLASGPNSCSCGVQTKATGYGAFSFGSGSVAGGDYSVSGGYKATASDKYSFVWNGNVGVTNYASHGNWTFNINPIGGTSGFYIGNTNLKTILDNTQAAAEATAANAGNLSSGTVASARLPIANASTVGAVKGDGSTVSIAADGTISVVGGGGGGTDANAVHYTADTGKTTNEQAVARNNIGAADAATVAEIEGKLVRDTESEYGYGGTPAAQIRGGHFILRRKPVIRHGFIKKLHLSYVADEATGNVINVMVCSYDDDTGKIKIKSMQDLTFANAPVVSGGNDVACNIEVNKGDLIGFRGITCGALKYRNYAADETFLITGTYAVGDEITPSGNAAVLCVVATVEEDGLYSSAELDGRIAQNETEIAEVKDAMEKSDFSEMDIVLMGDSITQAAYSNCTGTNGWATYFKEKVSPKSIINYAVGGAFWHHWTNTVLDTSGRNTNFWNNVIFNQIYRMSIDIANGVIRSPDLIVIAAGTNDVRGHNCWTNSADTTFSNRLDYVADASAFPNYDLSSPLMCQSTYAIRFDVELLMQKYPSAQVVLLTPLQRGDVALYAADTIPNGNAIEKCANYLGVPCIRQDRECCLYAARERVARPFTQDGLHPNKEGAKRIGYHLASRIREFLECKNFSGTAQ